MNREGLRKILRGKCVTDEACEAAIDELLNLHSVSGCLPSDKEIINKAKGKYPHKKTKQGTYYEGKCKGFIDGANWLKWKYETAITADVRCIKRGDTYKVNY